MSFFLGGFASCLTTVPAISFFDRAKGSASTESPETSLADMQPLVSYLFPLLLSVFFFLIQFLFLLGSLRKPSFLLRISPQMRMLAKLCMHVQRPKAGKPLPVILDLAPLASRPRTYGWTNHDTGPPPFVPSFASLVFYWPISPLVAFLTCAQYELPITHIHIIRPHTLPPPFSTFVYLNFVVPSFFLISSFHSCIPCGCGGSLTHVTCMGTWTRSLHPSSSPSTLYNPCH